MGKDGLTWDIVKSTFDLSEEEEEEIKLEEEIIKATIEARKKAKLSQRDLSSLTGLKQPAIARLEKRICSPRMNTLIKVLYSMGYTIKIVPLEKNKNK